MQPLRPLMLVHAPRQHQRAMRAQSPYPRASTVARRGQRAVRAVARSRAPWRWSNDPAFTHIFFGRDAASTPLDAPPPLLREHNVRQNANSEVYHSAPPPLPPLATPNRRERPPPAWLGARLRARLRCERRLRRAICDTAPPPPPSLAAPQSSPPLGPPSSQPPPSLCVPLALASPPPPSPPPSPPAPTPTAPTGAGCCDIDCLTSEKNALRSLPMYVPSLSHALSSSVSRLSAPSSHDSLPDDDADSSSTPPNGTPVPRAFASAGPPPRPAPLRPVAATEEDADGPPPRPPAPSRGDAPAATDDGGLAPPPTDDPGAAGPSPGLCPSIPLPPPLASPFAFVGTGSGRVSSNFLKSRQWTHAPRLRLYLPFSRCRVATAAMQQLQHACQCVGLRVSVRAR